MSVNAVAVVAAAAVAFFAAFFAVNPGGSFIFLLFVVADAEAFFLVADEDVVVDAWLFVLFLDPLRPHEVDFFSIMLLLLLLLLLLLAV